MKEEVFVVTLQASPQFYRCFPRVDARDLALIVRDAVRAKSRGSAVPTPFKISVAWHDELASASGEIGKYVSCPSGDFDETPEELVTYPGY